MSIRLRTLLSISHGLVLGTFTVTFLTVFFYLTKPPAPPPDFRDSPVVSNLLRQGISGQALLTRLDRLGHRYSKEIDLFDADGNWQYVAGTRTPIQSPSFLGDVLNGHIYQHFVSPRTHVFWIPLSLEYPNSHAMRWEVQRSQDILFSEVKHNVTTACCVALLSVLLIVLPLSQVLAAPIRALAILVNRFGREGYKMRSDLKGAAEFVELGNSFNRMAEFVESNTTELREQKEAALRIEALRGRFLSDVSHSLRTPLASILAINNSLIEGAVEDETISRHRIRREVIQVTKTIQRLLALSRWERAEPVLLLEDIPVGELLLEVADSLQDWAKQTATSLAFEGLDPYLIIRADRQKARDVLQILIENVIEHAGQNALAVIRLEDLENQILILIDDDGVGLPGPLQVEVEVRIERGTPAVTGKACLGLAIASRLVEAHGGKLSLSNRAEGGMRATFSFPKG